MSCDWHGVVWYMIVGNMAHTRGVLLHFWVLQPAPETLLTAGHIAQFLFKQGNWFQFEPCTQSNAYALLSKRRQSSKFAGPKIKNNWNFSLVRCTGLPQCRASLHPCCMCRCEILNGRRAAKLLWRTNIGWNCQLIKMNSSLILLDQKNSWKSIKKNPNSCICRSFASLSNLAPTKASFYLHGAPFQAAKLERFFLFFIY